MDRQKLSMTRLGDEVAEKKRTRPFDMIATASSFLSDFSVKRALNLLCKETLPEALRRTCSRAVSSTGEIADIKYLSTTRRSFGGLGNPRLGHAQVKTLKSW